MSLQPQYIARVQVATDALRAGESRESLLSEHGSIVVKAAEIELAAEVETRAQEVLARTGQRW